MRALTKNNVIKAYNVLVNKEKQISDLRSTVARQKMLKMLNYLKEVV